MTAKKLHRMTAILLAIFIISHLVVHLTALGGSQTHINSLDAIQWVYRNPVGEIILVLAILTQIVTGVQRLKVKPKIKQMWARAQVISGAYLIFFLVVHTSAALYTHHIFGIETDFYWAAGSLAFSPIKYGFALYYFAAVIAVFVHFACALHFGWPGRFKVLKRALPIIGVVTAVLVLLPLGGVFYDIIIPEDVAGYYQKYFGIFGL